MTEVKAAKNKPDRFEPYQLDNKIGMTKNGSQEKTFPVAISTRTNNNISTDESDQIIDEERLSRILKIVFNAFSSGSIYDWCLSSQRSIFLILPVANAMHVSAAP